MLKRLEDADWAVRQQLAASLGGPAAGTARNSGRRVLLERHADDPVVDGCRPERTARQRSGGAREAAAGGRADAAARDRDHDDRRDDRAGGAGRRRSRRVRAAIGRCGQDPTGSVRRCCAARKSRVLGAAMPGDRPGGAAPPPPGERPVSDLSGRPRRSGRRVCLRDVLPLPPAVAAGTRTVRLNARTGGAVVRARAAGGDLGTARRAVSSARIEWPGKPGAAAPVAAADRGRAAAVQRRTGSLPQRLSGLPSAGRARPGANRAEPGRIRARARRARDPGADSAERQRRSDRSDAACRHGPAATIRSPAC